MPTRVTRHGERLVQGACDRCRIAGHETGSGKLARERVGCRCARCSVALVNGFTTRPLRLWDPKAAFHRLCRWVVMGKLGGIGLLVTVAAACGGGDDSSGECIPGDASRVGYVCSEDGKWEPRVSGITVLTARDQSICPDLPPGSYVLKKSVPSGGINCPLLAAEVLAINSDGSVIAEENPLVKKAADSCTDKTTIDGCTSTVNRTCTVSGCSAKVLLTIDADTWTGAESLTVVCPDGSNLSCSYDAWFESR